MFKNKYIKAKSKPDEEIMDKIELFANYTHEFDFPEDGILKWKDWTQNNPDYDPAKLDLDDDKVVNINEELLKDDLPVIENDLSQNDEFRRSIQDSMEKLTASVFTLDLDDNDDKQSIEDDTNKGDRSDDDMEIIYSEPINNKNKNTTKVHNKSQNNLK